jgi:TPR repeat protein
MSFRKSWEKGLSEGKYYYATLLDSGLGVQRDSVKAIQRYKEVAADSDANPVLRVEAMLSIGNKYEFGKDLPKNPSEAFRFCGMAADTGSPKGQCVLGVAYRDGIGTASNPVKAVALFKNAAEKDYPDAQVGSWISARFAAMVQQTRQKKAEIILALVDIGILKATKLSVSAIVVAMLSFRFFL